LSTKKQERARARRRYDKRQAALGRRMDLDQRTARLIAIVGTVVVVLAVLALLGSKYAATPTPAAQTSPSLTAAGCQQPPKPLGTTAKLTLPSKATAEGKTFTGDIDTNCGTITVELYGTKAPQAVASFIQLATSGYWVDSPCHRLTADPTLKVLQCGDPTGTGSGTPGYGFGVENAPKDGVYPTGTLAMARTSDAAKGNGGQFFIVYGNSTLPDKNGYTIFGKVTAGLDIVDKVAAVGVAAGGDSPTDGAPAAPISILRVAVTEKKA